MPSSSLNQTRISASIAAAIACTWIGYGILLVRSADQKRLEFNQLDWKVSRLSWPSYLVRWINAGGFTPWYAAIMLPILKHTLIHPALRKSIATMEQADRQGVVPKILCNQQARTDMQQRLQAFYKQILNCQSLTQFGKTFLYLQAAQALQNHAGWLDLGMRQEIQDETVEKPVFIVSVPRTGTTILHRTMALDREQWRSFDVCDTLAPPPPVARWDDKGRQAKAKEIKSLMETVEKFIYPGWMECLDTMHTVRPHEADEDHYWSNSVMGHPYLESIVKLYQDTSYVHALENKEMAEYKFAWLKLIIQIHQFVDRTTWTEKDRPCPDRPWLLKDPTHSANLPELLQTFPDARLICTHRLPAEIVPSLAKLAVLFVTIDFVPASPGSTSLELGALALKRMQMYVNGIVEFTESQEKNSMWAYRKSSDRMNGSNHDNNRRIDFGFRDVSTNVPATIEKIYAHFLGTKPSRATKEVFLRYLEASDRAKVGNQQRSLEDFGFTQEDMDKAFRAYNQLFF